MEREAILESLPYSLARSNLLDLNYYEEQQILSAAIMVLSSFSKKKGDLELGFQSPIEIKSEVGVVPSTS